MKYTERHGGIAVIKDKTNHKEAMERLARFEECAGLEEKICDEYCRFPRELKGDDLIEQCRMCDMISLFDLLQETEVNNSEQEAQAMGAGEMKIAIAQKLEEVRAGIVNIRHMLLTEDSALDQAILSWKKEQLERWAIFLEDLLSGGVKKSVGEDWKQNTMKRFERVE